VIAAVGTLLYRRKNMAHRTRCQLCGEWIGQRQEIVRVITERVKKKKGDGQDPENWTGYTEDNFVCYIGHIECTEIEIKAREHQVEIPGMNQMYGLFDEDDDKKSHLRILPGG
jgi:hypothetical protein